MKKLFAIIPVEAALYGLIWWLAQPALSFSSIGFWAMLALAAALVAIAALIVADDCYGDGGYHTATGAGIVFGVIVVLALLIFLFCSPMFMAKSYAQLYDDDLIRDENMSEYFATLDNIPLTDKDTANKLVARKMGSLKGDLVSQFNAGNAYQITYNGVSYRVAPLVYAGFFQWSNNKYNGIPAYVLVNMTTQENEIVYLEDGMKYSPSERFGRDLKRHLRGQYPTEIFGSSVFEIDEEGRPYWVTPVIEHRIGLFLGEDVKAVIVTDAIDGKSKWYNTDDVPAWVDNVYPTDMLIAQFDCYGKYQDGFWNAQFAKKNATVTTDGYNYVPDENDVNIYTGVTSLVMDESNVGFVLINKRTKAATYYEYAGAEEYSAMSSAEGMVQQYGYTATFPLLVNIEGVPTYYMALKDAGGLVKSYALVNVAEYQTGVSGATMEETLDKYLIAIGKKVPGDLVEIPDKEQTETKYTVEVTGVIEEIRTGDVNGTTFFYVKLVDNSVYYKVSLENSETIILANVGDEIVLLAEDKNDTIINAIVN